MPPGAAGPLAGTHLSERSNPERLPEPVVAEEELGALVVPLHALRRRTQGVVHGLRPGRDQRGPRLLLARHVRVLRGPCCRVYGGQLPYTGAGSSAIRRGTGGRAWAAEQPAL